MIGESTRSFEGSIGAGVFLYLLMFPIYFVGSGGQSPLLSATLLMVPEKFYSVNP